MDNRVRFSLAGLRFLRDAQLYRGDRSERGRALRDRWLAFARQRGTIVAHADQSVTVQWDGGKRETYAPWLLTDADAPEDGNLGAGGVA